MNELNPINLRVKIFADGANLEDMRSLAKNPLIKGFTTNPTLMRQAGIVNYESFAHQVLDIIKNRPVCFEVFADELEIMYKQAKIIASWGKNVTVKVPVTNTLGEFTGPILGRLSREGVHLNVTAIMTRNQIAAVCNSLSPDMPAILSIFAGRIADTGQDPTTHVCEALKVMSDFPLTELLWASPREVLNIFQADQTGCHIITVTSNFLKKLELFNKDLEEFSLDTVKMFFQDALTAKYQINLG